MHEIIPLLAGAVVGLIASWIPSGRVRMLVFVALCLGVGALISLLMGELGGAWFMLFIGFDAVLVWLGALVAVKVATWWANRRVLTIND